jgi:AraC-like DNA-binding protein
MSVRYRQHSLPQPLSRFVECVWFLRSNGDGPPSGPERIVPDGCPELILQFAEACRAGRSREALILQPKAFLVGPLTSCFFVEPVGAVSTMGIRFRPGGLARFLPIEAAQITDRQIALEDLWGREGRRLEERLCEAGDDASRVAVASRFLMGRLSGSDTRERPVERAVTWMLKRRGPVSVEGLAQDFGLSRRHLERVFRSEAGMGPARLGRVIRFQNVFRALASEASDWVSIALRVRVLRPVAPHPRLPGLRRGVARRLPARGRRLPQGLRLAAAPGALLRLRRERRIRPRRGAGNIHRLPLRRAS